MEDRNEGFEVKILNPSSNDKIAYIKEVRNYLENLENVDIFAASAGFDQGIEDWGHLLYPKGYTEIGKLIKEYSEKLCDGRRFALLEGGYNHRVLGTNVDAFCQGFK